MQNSPDLALRATAVENVSVATLRKLFNYHAIKKQESRQDIWKQLTLMVTIFSLFLNV